MRLHARPHGRAVKKPADASRRQQTPSPTPSPTPSLEAIESHQKPSEPPEAIGSHQKTSEAIGHLESHIKSHRTHLAEELAEQRTREVETLLGVVVAVVGAARADGGHEQLVHDVADEVSLLRLAVFGGAHVRQRLLLEDLPRVLDALVARHAHRRATLADEVHGDLLRLDDEGLLERRTHHLHERRVGEVAHDVLEDLAVGDEAEGTEDDHDRHGVADVRHRRVDARARHALDLAGIEEPHVHRRRRPRVVHRRLYLRDVRVLARLLLLKDVDGVVGHLLLGDQHLLGAVDDKVAALGCAVWTREARGERGCAGVLGGAQECSVARSGARGCTDLIVRALAQVGELMVVGVREDAVRGAQHDGHLPEEDLRQLLVLLVLLAVRVDGDGRARQVHIKRRGVRQVAQARLVGEHGGGSLVGLNPRRLGEVNLAEGDLVRLGAAVLHQRIVLLLRNEVQRRALVDNLLDRVHDELIEGVELLPHETLFLEVCGDNLPAVLLVDWRIVERLVILLVFHRARRWRRRRRRWVVGGGGGGGDAVALRPEP